MFLANDKKLCNVDTGIFEVIRKCVKMALVSGGRSSTLNPNAPLFIPAAVRQVEDFSPEWWQLVTTSTWFHDYWVSQNQGDDGFYGANVQDLDNTDIVNLLPDSIDLGNDDDYLSLDAQFEEFIRSAEIDEANKMSSYSMMGFPKNGYGVHAPIQTQNLTLTKSVVEKSPRSPTEMAKYWEKPAKMVSPRINNKRIQQPR
jgi:hypothetical protein